MSKWAPYLQSLARIIFGFLILRHGMEQVLGYPDSPSIFLAVERGELDGRMFDLSSVKATRPHWLKPASGFNALLQFARRTRHPDLPEVIHALR